MTEVIIKIKEPSELQRLYSFLEQFKMEYRFKTQSAPTKKKGDIDKVLKLIDSGAFEIPNFDEFMADFEENRQDRPLPGRE